MSLRAYLKNKKQEKYNISGIHIEEFDVPETVSVRGAVEKVLTRIPQHLSHFVKSIKVGSFSILKDREIQAMYSSGTIYATNNQKNNDDLLDDLIHEFAHSIEEGMFEDVYGDGSIEGEFLHKRKKMWSILKSRGLEFDLNMFLETSYSKEFDDLLHKKVGYDTMRVLFRDIVYSPYAATSMREYFANGFEAFFMREDVKRLKDLSPSLYKKIIILMDKKDEI
jgi:hypothetical protein